MKSSIVAMLAALALSACGVGVEEGSDDLAQQQQGLTLPTSSQGEKPRVPRDSATKSSGTVGLPQDPIPLFEGRLVDGVLVITPVGPNSGNPNGMSEMSKN